MKTVVFSTKPYDEELLRAANNGMHDLVFLETRLSVDTATLAIGAGAVCAFVNDDLGAEVLRRLSFGGVRAIALRSTGFNHVDLRQAKALAKPLSQRCCAGHDNLAHVPDVTSLAGGEPSAIPDREWNVFGHGTDVEAAATWAGIETIETRTAATSNPLGI